MGRAVSRLGEAFSLLPLREKVDRRASAETVEGCCEERNPERLRSVQHPSSDFACASRGSATFSLKGRRWGWRRYLSPCGRESDFDILAEFFTRLSVRNRK
jgi:hypothetical protein